MYSPEARANPTVPWLFDGYGQAGLLAATLIAASASATHVVFLAGALLLMGVLSRLWGHFSLARLTYSRRTNPNRAFCGESLILETTLRNRKLLPLPWLEVWERLPMDLLPKGETERSALAPECVWFSQGVSLWPYQRARWRHPLHCRRRGVFALDTAVVRSGDPFGVCERQAPVSHHLEVIVYPRVVPLRRLGLALRHPAVDVSSRTSHVSDPSRTAGVREYRPGDPRRLIHWRASAHSGQLQVRVLEHSASLQVWLALDAGSFDRHWGLYRETLFELSLSALASIAVYLNQAGCPVGLLVHGDPPTHLLPSANPGQLESLLERLARVEARAAPGPPREAFSTLPRGSTVILAASDAAGDLSTTIATLQEAGRQVLLLAAGPGALPTAVSRQRVLRLTPGLDLAATLEGLA